MIFVTVGSDIPFDRLVRTIDSWARENQRRDVFAQVGKGAWEPEFIPFAHMLTPTEFRERLTAATVIVAHAGMGTILSALQHSKPVLVMPRRGKLGETRNDHQMDTARQLLELGRVNVAFDEKELRTQLDTLGDIEAREPISPYAELDLISGLRAFIHGHPVPYVKP